MQEELSESLLHEVKEDGILCGNIRQRTDYVTKTADIRNYRAFFIDSNLQEELSESLLHEVKEDGILCGNIRQRTGLFEEIRSQAAKMLEDFC